MSKFYFHPVNDEWLPYFERTVESTISLDDVPVPEELEEVDDVRVWGTTYESKKETYLDDMEEDDLVLFTRNRRVFAAGRVGRVFKSRDFGRVVWDNADSELGYTLKDFEEVDFPYDIVLRDLGYSDGSRVQGFMRPAVSSQQNIVDKHGSIEEAFAAYKENSQSGQGGELSDWFSSGGEDESKPMSEIDDDMITNKAPYYWVNQSNNPAELEEGYLRAPREDLPQYDLQKLEEGDIVFNYTDGEIVGYSIVVGPAYAVREDGEEKRQVDIEVHLFDEPMQFAEVFGYLWRADVRLDKYYPVNKGGINQQYFFNLSQKAGDYLLEQGGAKDSNTDRLRTRLESPEIEVGLPDDLYFYAGEETRLRQQVNAALKAGKHIIFTGPPGTGKSRIAKAVAEQAATNEVVDGYTFTTATAEWSSFDTIGGYVPSNGDSELEFDPRLFLQCFRDQSGTVQNEWLVIDELNRANIDKALGPLFSVLSHDSVELPYERDGRIKVDWVDEDEDLSEIAQDPDRFPVTPAWRMIGTMNTFDKTSLYDLSFAFMRRFSFIHIGVPSVTDENGVVVRDLLDPAEGPNYATVWQRSLPHLQDTIDDHHSEVMVLWAIINEHRSIGPAIILDIFEQLAAFQGGDQKAPLTSAVINYIFPQLEGMRQSDQEELLTQLEEGGAIEAGDGPEPVDLPLDVQYLKRKANDMFDLDLDVQTGL
ncbi:AAA family ATPase [Haloarchaeobius sp. TZWSO28]|uniref:AAA family ATPase n=1 Tax=Haloarchaeobius sp. TZWSO28 TaxID=3446119 RepID=UPI003EBAAD5E